MPPPFSLARALFDEDVAVAEGDPRELSDPAALFSDEAAYVATAIDTRQIQFTGGRVAARKALVALGHPPVSIPPRADRSPSFPAGAVGSITHTRWWCAAAVCATEGAAGIGIDVEPDTPLRDRLFESVLTPGEREAARRLPDDARGALGKLVFSAKEAAYKAQYERSRCVFGFHGMRIEILDGDPQAASGRVRAYFLRDAEPYVEGDRIEGRFARGGGYLMTGFRVDAP